MSCRGWDEGRALLLPLAGEGAGFFVSMGAIESAQFGKHLAPSRHPPVFHNGKRLLHAELVPSVQDERKLPLLHPGNLRCRRSGLLRSLENGCVCFRVDHAPPPTVGGLVPHKNSRRKMKAKKRRGHVEGVAAVVFWRVCLYCNPRRPAPACGRRRCPPHAFPIAKELAAKVLIEAHLDRRETAVRVRSVFKSFAL
jgi:hypothetical protein